MFPFIQCVEYMKEWEGEGLAQKYVPGPRLQLVQGLILERVPLK